MKRALVLVALACGCSAQGSGTGGRSLFFDVALAPPSYMNEGGRFTTFNGWEVELDEAVIAVGPLYLWEQGNYAGLARDDDEPMDDLVGWVGELVVPTAHAHPGDVHFAGGELRGEFLEQVAFDLLRGEAGRVGRARGVSGDARAVSVILDPPTAATRGDADALFGHHAWVVGTAWRGREVVRFEGGLSIPAEGIQRQVDGVPIDVELDDGGTLVLGVEPRAWFADAHFEQLVVDNAAGDRKVIDADSQVAAAWYIGARTAAAFSARWTTDETFGDYE